MIRFLLKGLFRDRSRSLLPVIVVTIGVMLAVFMRGYINGIMVDMIEQTARFTTGHVKVMTQGYADNIDQLPNDLALTNADSLTTVLESEYPGVTWVSRIKFGGYLTVADTLDRIPAPASAMGLDLLSKGSEEAERLNLKKSLVQGHLPKVSGEILISDEFAGKLAVKPGDLVVLKTSGTAGHFHDDTLKISGTIRFGNTALDRATIVTDLKDAQKILIMENRVGEILGFFSSGYYDDETADPMLARFKTLNSSAEGDLIPQMYRLRDQEGLSLYVDISQGMGNIVIFIFMIAMSLVLWNAGLLGGLRRYGEIGIRLAIGETKGQVYRSMINESLLIGFIGTIIGTSIGLSLSWLMQTYGLDISEFTKASTTGVMMPNIMRARITPPDFYMGLVPGVLSTVAGTMLAGIGIYKRNTAMLFKELEA
ncbi:MAG: FtsX-like permease family protein [Bacteroidales bacterium]|nr:FtsX-like permease family protein [Bacteroidales bacterium]